MRAIYLISVLAASCSMQTNDKVTEIAAVDLKESSALEKIAGSDLLWTIEDAGNGSTLYGIDNKGEIKAEVTINKNNQDWESLASDKDGNLYIGDFGNNDNERQDLAIYKINKNDLKTSRADVSSVVSFYYPEQKDFPAGKTDRFYDCEAFVEHNGSFYLFTKNRSAKFDGSFRVYKVPNKTGRHAAELIGTLSTCDEKTCLVTGADISSDGSTIALLTADKVYLVSGFAHKDFSNAKIKVVDLGHNSQKEGICFKDDNTLLIIDERTKTEGGVIYETKLRN